jgi:hypothetical protein
MPESRSRRKRCSRVSRRSRAHNSPLGTTGIPLLSACVLLGEGRYTGLCVRTAPKGSPSGRQIEGPADRTRPIVMIDDSLSSGTSLLRGIQVLERAGFEVEGAIAFVNFPNRGGRERAEALGYRVETLFDIWSDIEPGEKWLPYGMAAQQSDAWTRDPRIGTALTARARDVLRAVLCGTPVPPKPLAPNLVPQPFSAVGVTLYRNGVAGSSISSRLELDEALVAAATAAAKDHRFTILSPDALKDIQPAVSVLFDPEWIGFCDKAKAARKLRLGRDSIAVRRGESIAMFLESVAPHHGWNKDETVRELLRKARLADGPAHWTTFRTATWRYPVRSQPPQTFGFSTLPFVRFSWKNLDDDLTLMSHFVKSNLSADGQLQYAQIPVPGRRIENGSTARKIFTLASFYSAARRLGRADWAAAARQILMGFTGALDEHGRLLLGGELCGPMAESMLLAASVDLKLGRRTATLAAQLCDLIRDDGAVYPNGQRVRSERDNDYLPNVAALALAKSRSVKFVGKVERFHAYQLRRFRNLHRWGQAGWLPQVCAELHAITRDRSYANTAFEVADWCIDNQVAATGAYLSDLSPGGPTFHTAFIAEGMADALSLALACGDTTRSAVRIF